MKRYRSSDIDNLLWFFAQGTGGGSTNPYNQGDGDDNPYNLVPGQYNFMLQNAQDFLIELSPEYETLLGNGGADGLWGTSDGSSNASRTAIQAFQADHPELEVTEYLDAATYNLLRDLWLQHMRDNYSSLSASEKYWIDKMDTFTSFFKDVPTANPEIGDLAFGSDRTTTINGVNYHRAHAGVDFYQAEGTEVYAMSSGTIIAINGFYKGTYEIVVKNDDDGSLSRYTEIWPNEALDESLSGNIGISNVTYDSNGAVNTCDYQVPDIGEGIEIEQGQLLGTIKHTFINSKMLHLESYMNDNSNLWLWEDEAQLSDTANSTVEDQLYVPDDDFYVVLIKSIF